MFSVERHKSGESQFSRIRIYKWIRGHFRPRAFFSKKYESPTNYQLLCFALRGRLKLSWIQSLKKKKENVEIVVKLMSKIPSRVHRQTRRHSVINNSSSSFLCLSFVLFIKIRPLSLIYIYYKGISLKCRTSPSSGRHSSASFIFYESTKPQHVV